MTKTDEKKDAMPGLKAGAVMIIATVTVVSAVWGFVHVKMMAIKNEQIKLMEMQNKYLRESGPVPKAVKELGDRLIPLTLAFPMDPIDGRVSVGTAIKTPTEISELIIKAEEFRKGKKFDLAAAKLDEIDALLPGFRGTPYFRFLIEKDKLNTKEALALAEEAIQNLPDDIRVLPAYKFAVEAHVQNGDKKQAEDICRTAIELDPENKTWQKFFKESFGYEPSVLKE